MEFTDPTIVEDDVEVLIEEADIDSEFWETSLIMHVLVGDLTMNAVKQYMKRFWNFVTLLEMF